MESHEQLRDPNKIDIYDTTLRDGLQTKGLSVSHDDRLVIARQLDEIGVDYIEAGFPASGNATDTHEFKAVRAVAEIVENAGVVALCRLVPGDIENGWAAVEPAKHRGGAGLHLFISTSEIHMNAEEETPASVKGKTISEVRRAVETGASVEFSAQDATRAHDGFTGDLCEIAADNGATTINIPDTTGALTPRGFGQLVEVISKRIHTNYPDVIISAHNHNDRGLAAASAIEAIGAGARQIETTVNGLGPRMGNAVLSSIIVNIREGGDPIPKDAYTNVDPSRLRQLAHLVAKLSGKETTRTVDTLPVISSTAFEHVEGIHQHLILRNPETYESMDAAIYDQEAGGITIGPLSGKAAVKSRLEELGITADSDVLKQVTRTAKAFASHAGRDLGDNELERFMAEAKGEEYSSSVSLTEIHKYDDSPLSHIELNNHGEPVMVDVDLREDAIEHAVKAINEALDFDGHIKDWHGRALKGGEDADAGAYVHLNHSGRVITAYAEGTSADRASINAYVTAVDMSRRIVSRTWQAYNYNQPTK